MNCIQHNKEKWDVRIMIRMAMCVATISVANFIIIPLPFTPVVISACTIAMGLTAYIMTPKQTFIVMVTYLILGGVIGLPILSGGVGGLAKLFGPVGGFYFSFCISYAVVSLLKGKNNSFKRYFIVGVFPGIPLSYVGGLISMVYCLDVHLSQAIVMAVYPFIVGDIIKCAVAAFIGVKLNNAFANL